MTGHGTGTERCRALTQAGQPCRAPSSMVDHTGFCPAHRPGARERLVEAGRRGGRATRVMWRGKGLASSDLPPLRTPQDAETWLEALGRAVATNELGHHEATAVTRTIREWLRAHEAGAVSERVERLRRQLDELRAGKLKVVR